MANKTYGDFVFGVRDCKVAAFGSTTAYDVNGVQTANITLNQMTAELPGDDVVKAQISRLASGTITLTNAGLADEALEIVTGKTFTTASSTPTETNTLLLKGADNFPYILIGVQAYDKTTGDIHAYVWKAKLADGITFNFENGNWMTPELSFNFIHDDTNDRLFTLIQHETAAALSFS